MSTSFTVSVELPGGGAGPYPAIVGLGGGFLGFPLDTSLVADEGVAVITYDPYGSDSSTGLLVAWSWGVSRIIDVIEQAHRQHEGPHRCATSRPIITSAKFPLAAASMSMENATANLARAPQRAYSNCRSRADLC